MSAGAHAATKERDGSNLLDPILEAASEFGASDVHLSAGAVVLVRLNGQLVPLPGHPRALAGDWLEAMLLGVLGSAKLAEFAAAGEVDLAYSLSGGQRVRVNVFRQYGGIAAAMRLVPQHLPSLLTLGVPEAASGLALRSQGLVLVTGPSGSGKSTTLAAMIDMVNCRRSGHIVTLEDPIEYLHQSRSCLVHQREIGADSMSFTSALRSVLRQDPDVVMIGELRDPASIAIALTAAETGRLVLGTLHTQSAAKSIDRIIDSFPSAQQNQVRAQLGETLQGVISQVLLPRSDGAGRVLATEVLVHTDAVANQIREGRVAQLQTVMQTSSAAGMHTLDHSLQDLVRHGLVTRDVASEYASDQAALAAVVIDPAMRAPINWSPADATEGE
ncbi:MAG TPA: PilT/PilU family type 4a pilus ATPase [Propionicimonas sp.]|jgi:twitching motility protein PilT|uniref:type IV pilus twitching motility protein PilT n=1 Tax=Propionicimonas sp. TaxID=1955623 RepID=UPI002F3EFD9F